jgi:hypothetical protein
MQTAGGKARAASPSAPQTARGCGCTKSCALAWQSRGQTGGAGGAGGAARDASDRHRATLRWFPHRGRMCYGRYLQGVQGAETGRGASAAPSEAGVGRRCPTVQARSWPSPRPRLGLPMHCHSRHCSLTSPLACPAGRPQWLRELSSRDHPSRSPIELGALSGSATPSLPWSFVLFRSPATTRPKARHRSRPSALNSEGRESAAIRHRR